MTIRSSVIAQISQVAAEHGKRTAPLTDDLPLLDSGLDSLCLAVIVARLEEELGVDPFSTANDAPFPVTIGDVIALYEGAVAPAESVSPGDVRLVSETIGHDGPRLADESVPAR